MHEIRNTDGLALNRVAAWHGLGNVIPRDFTPRQGLALSGLENANIIQCPLFAKLPDGSMMEVPTNVLNYRLDTQDQFKVVSKDYQLITNEETADFCEALAGEAKTVYCESVGSVQGGRRVWFLLKGEAFQVAKADEIFPYILVSNGHDGSSPFRVTPTTVRVVCSNTLHQVIPRREDGTLGESAFMMKHTSGIKERVEEARNALLHYQQTLAGTKEVITALAKKLVKQADIDAFFVEVYQETFGDIPKNPQDKKEQRARDKAVSAYKSFDRRFDDELHLTGPTAWGVFNAFSGIIQHDMKARGKDDSDRVEKRVKSNLFGLNQDRTLAALNHAYKLVS